MLPTLLAVSAAVSYLLLLYRMYVCSYVVRTGLLFTPDPVRLFPVSETTRRRRAIFLARPPQIPQEPVQGYLEGIGYVSRWSYPDEAPWMLSGLSRKPDQTRRDSEALPNRPDTYYAVQQKVTNEAMRLEEPFF